MGNGKGEEKGARLFLHNNLKQAVTIVAVKPIVNVGLVFGRDDPPSSCLTRGAGNMVGLRTGDPGGIIAVYDNRLPFAFDFNAKMDISKIIFN